MPLSEYTSLIARCNGVFTDPVAVQMEAVLRGGRSTREGELCVQAVFSLLDTLKLWLEDALPSLMSHTGAGSTSESANFSCQPMHMTCWLSSCCLCMKQLRKVRTSRCL